MNFNRLKWFALFSIPYEKTTCGMEGTINAPEKVVEALLSLDPFDINSRISVNINEEGVIESLDRHLLIDLSAEESIALIRMKAIELLERGLFLVSVGGEHTVAYPLVSACNEISSGITVFHLDAHSDLRNTYQGTILSHACSMRRIFGLGVRTISFGVRSVSEEEALFIENERILVYGTDIDFCEIRSALSTIETPVYITIDIDVMDPIFMPATGTPEPSGIDWWTLIAILKLLFHEAEVIGVDLVEFLPSPLHPWTTRLCARLLQSCLALEKVKRRRTNKIRF